MSKHIYWKEIAEQLINGGWGHEDASVYKATQSASDQRLMVALLIDIAESLRVLRCLNFKGIPRTLQEIMRNTKKKTYKKKKKKPIVKIKTVKKKARKKAA